MNTDEFAVLCTLRLPARHADLDRVVQSGWVVTYRHPKKRHLQITVYTKEKPKKRRTFTFRGGRFRTEAIHVVNLSKANKEAIEMARKAATKTKSKSKKAADEELEELEGLEDLEDLEDLDDEDLEEEDEDVEEDEDEDEDDEEDEDEDDDEDDEDEDDEDEEPAPKKRTSKSKAAAAKKTASKSKAPAKKTTSSKTSKSSTKSTSAKKKSGKAKAGPRQALPDGKLSPADVAELSDGAFDARAVRVFLRNHEDTYPKGEENFRYAFTKKQGERIVRTMKKARKE